TFEGRFFAVRDFLANLERLTNQIYWRSMAYEVSEYPNAQVTLEVYTLSTEKAFIGVE
ncbi:MAG TPA: MSHA biogenesis protein MshJ, partial [Alteromonas sp.]|nr:MSHA biogenesis protein MshJ [Alteromonas sp.]